MLDLKNRKTRKHVILVTVLVAILSFGFIRTSDTDFEIARNLDIFVTLFREVNTLYVDNTEPKKLIDASIEGMLSSLDPYTTYIPEEDMDDFKFMTTGKYGGIGALIRKAGEYTMVSEPYEGFPAQKAGIFAGDTIISIDGITTKGKTISAVSEMLKGTPNTTLKLQIKRYGCDTIIEKTFSRMQVAIPNVPYYGLMKGDVGYIMLGNFMKDAGKEVKAAFVDLKSQGAKSIVLDLRGNPGGLLDEAINVTNIWVAKDLEIVTTRGKNKQLISSYKTQNIPTDTTIPLAVIVNRGSASASEIVAGSLQDLDRAIIIGQRTFGKGLVQTTRPLSYNAHLKITTAKYYIPSGRCIQALDYSHRNEDGSVGYIPDSLKTRFKTINGRPVYDGGGIDPDIKMDGDSPGNITVALFTNNLIFDFGTVYFNTNSSIASPSSFVISDAIYADFIDFISKRDFDYSTKSNEQLKELIKTAKREGYYEYITAEVEGLEAKLHGNITKDLQTFRKEIQELLKDEIVGRYYYQKGRIEAGLISDSEVLKAIELLSDTKSTREILRGSYTGTTVFAYSSH